MHEIEPYYNWRHIYVASEDFNSPFYGYQNSLTHFTDQIYDHLIHPQWDNFGSETLFLKVLFVDYKEGFAIIEFFGEWNDVLHNDIMLLKRDVIDEMLAAGIDKYVLIFENVLNFHADATDYYEEWFEELEDGWAAAINVRGHVLQEMSDFNVDSFFVMGGKLDDVSWRTKPPQQIFAQVQSLVDRRLM